MHKLKIPSISLYLELAEHRIERVSLCLLTYLDQNNAEELKEDDEIFQLNLNMNQRNAQRIDQ